jgi:gliding motility-associated lipoprotein GldH
MSLIAGRLLLICLPFLLWACNSKNLLDENQPIEKNRWEWQAVKSFSADVEDTSGRYKIYLHFRHSPLFEWRNLWVKVSTVMPDNSSSEKRLNLQFCDAAGNWFGDCLGDHCDLKVLIQEHARFPFKGTYTFRLAQDMRENPLPYIQNVGISIEPELKP